MATGYLDSQLMFTGIEYEEAAEHLGSRFKTDRDKPDVVESLKLMVVVKKS